MSSRTKTNLPILDIKTIDDFQKIEELQQFSFICKQCGVKVVRQFRKARIDSYSLMLCRKCKDAYTIAKKFGSKEKWLNERKSKTEKTKINKFGSLKAAYDNRSKKTNETCLARYGMTQGELLQKKSKEGLIKKYGVPYALQSPEIMAHTSNRFKYEYQDIVFDSSWELAFWIFHKDFNHQILREPYALDYYTPDGKNHKYFPDFKVDGILYELKGLQFFDKDGNFRDPYAKNQDKAKAKYQCMIDNNVVIITDPAEYISYVENRYGKSYLLSFRLK